MTVEVTYTYNKCGISYTCLVTSILHMPLLHDTGDPAPKKKDPKSCPKYSVKGGGSERKPFMVTRGLPNDHHEVTK